MTTKDPLDQWSDAYTDRRGRTYIEHKRLRCPSCNSLKVPAQRGATDNGDGTASRPHLCHTCGAKFTAILI